MHVEESGRTPEEAIRRALDALGVSEADVSVEVLDAGTRGMLGLGARDARVRVTYKEGTSTVVRSMAQQLFAAMGYSPQLSVETREDAVHLEAQGPALGALIGRHGATLDAVDLLLEAMTTRRTGERVKVIVDVEGYRARRIRMLEVLARRVAERAQRESRPVALSPMGARERRVIHTTLAGDPGVVTYSEGEEPLRRVIVAPKEMERSLTPTTHDDRGEP